MEQLLEIKLVCIIPILALTIPCGWENHLACVFSAKLT